MKLNRRAFGLLACVPLGLPSPQLGPASQAAPYGLVVPYAPGGATDVIARMIAEKLSPGGASPS